jgi:hypothetical protein
MAQDLTTKTMTAPRAVIKINGFASGFMRNIRITENIARGNVQGISNLTLQEVPATGITCTLTADFFFISLKRPEVRAFLTRDEGKDIMLNTLILQERPIDIQIFSKDIESVSGNLVTSIKEESKTIATIRRFYINSQSFDIAENQISGLNISGQYLDPIYFT